MGVDTVGIIITPDAIRDGLLQDILKDLLSVGSMRIIWSKRVMFNSPEDIFTLYPKMPQQSFCSSVIRTMTLGESFAILIQGENAFSDIKKMKGELNLDGETLTVTGLRFKYKTWSLEEIEHLDCSNLELMNRIFEFRIHAAENPLETARICYLFMNGEELEFLKEIAPEVHSDLQYVQSSRAQ